MSKKISILQAINKRAHGEPYSADEQAIIELGREECRKSGLKTFGDLLLPLETRAALQIGAAGSGAEIKGVDTLGILAPLRAALVLVQAGATFLSNLTGDIAIPAYSGTTAKWKGEGAAAEDGAGSTSKVEMSPKRITAYLDVDKKFLAQDSVEAEAMLIQDMINAVVGKLEATIFGKEAGSATQPGGFFAVAPSINGAASYANILELESAVDTANALVGKLSYITNAKGRGLLKSTPKVANQASFLMEPDGKVNTYPVLVTNHVATGLQAGGDEEGILFGNWGEFVIGQWGALDVLVDPFTRATNGEVRLTINAYFDAVARRAVSFAAGSLK